MYVNAPSNFQFFVHLYSLPTDSHQRSESGRRTVGSLVTGVWSNARPKRAFHWSLTL